MGGLAVLAILGLYIFLANKVFRVAKTTLAKVITLLLILLIPTADAIYGRIKLQQMCKAEGGLKVFRVAHGVEGFMADTANEKWIQQYGFQFSEGSSSPKIYYRFTMINGKLTREDNVTPKSNYRLYFKRVGWIDGTYMRDQYIVDELANSEILATDTQIAFNGGWAERLIALFSGAGGGGVAWCSNAENNAMNRIVNIVTSTLKNKEL